MTVNALGVTRGCRVLVSCCALRGFGLCFGFLASAGSTCSRSWSRWHAGCCCDGSRAHSRRREQKLDGFSTLGNETFAFLPIPFWILIVSALVSDSS